MQPLLVVAHPGFHQQARDPVLHLHHLLDQQPAVAQGSPPVADLGRCHGALRKEVATKTVGYLAGIDLVVLPLRRGDGTKHQRMSNLHLLGMRKQVIVDPAGEDRRFHGHHPGLGKDLDPGIKFASRRSDLVFLMDLAGRVLHAIADRLLVNVKSDVIHMSLRSLRG
jgi:hypothetical protein